MYLRILLLNERSKYYPELVMKFCYQISNPDQRGKLCTNEKTYNYIIKN